MTRPTTDGDTGIELVPFAEELRQFFARYITENPDGSESEAFAGLFIARSAFEHLRTRLSEQEVELERLRAKLKALGVTMGETLQVMHEEHMAAAGFPGGLGPPAAAEDPHADR